MHAHMLRRLAASRRAREECRRSQTVGLRRDCASILRRCVERGSLVEPPTHALRRMNDIERAIGKRARNLAYRRLGLAIVVATLAGTAILLAWLVSYLVR